MLRFIVAVFVIAFPGVAVACPPDLLHATPAEVDRAGRVYIPLSVDGHSVQALVCTSCAWSSLGEKLVDRLGIKKRPARVRYVNLDGSRVEYLAEPTTAKIGDMVLKDDYLVDSGSGDDAVIGLNLLIYFDFEIDKGKKTVSFYRHQNRCGRPPVAWPNTVSLPFDLKDETIKAVIDANGRSLRAGIFTGGGHSMMELAVARTQFGVTLDTPGVRKTGTVRFAGVDKPYDTYEYTMPQMTLSGLTFKDVPLQLVDLDLFGINLGMHELRQTRFFVAFLEKKIYIAPVEGATAAGR